MNLIGLAYNQKPEPTELTSPASEGGRQEDGELPRPDEEPPSRILDLSTAELIARDEFAEWDSPATIAAVESALSRLGKVVRLEANEDFPERLRQARPDIVFNIAEGFHGVNREDHVPAICEVSEFRTPEATPSRSRSASTKRERRRPSPFTGSRRRSSFSSRSSPTFIGWRRS